MTKRQGPAAAGHVRPAERPLSVVIDGSGAGETLTGTDQADTINGHGGDDVLRGLGGTDILNGGAGNDRLDGGLDADVMTGGTGDDTYVVSAAGDQTIELAGEGTDTVEAWISWTLAANVERLILLGGGFNGTGNASDNIITGNALNNVLYGMAGADTLYGGAGADFLDGGAGDDVMVGGIGDDTYVVGTTSDVVVELAGEGTDTVQTYVSGFTLADNLENLTLLGAAITGYGNSVGNVITGTDGVNYLYGRGGNDVINGGLGADYLYGEAGNDRLNGGVGDDLMYGGAGDDVYVIGSLTDYTFENANEGHDTTEAYVNWILWANIEDLVLLGAAQYGQGNSLNNRVTGNSLDNFLYGRLGDDILIGGDGHDTLYGAEGVDNLTGGAGNDVLDGGQEADVMTGGLGDDTYVVATAGDQTIEAAGEGIDTVTSWINWTLSANIENLTLLGGAFTGAGNALNNVIVGNGSANFLDGAGGDDVLTGGAGFDTFTFFNAFGHDRITDFTAGPGAGDQIRFSAGLFANFADLLSAATDTEAGVVIARDGQSVTLTGVTRAQLHANDFTFAVLPGAPTAGADIMAGVENQTVILDVLDNDTDPNGDALSIVRVDGQSIAVGQTVEIEGLGSVTLNANQTLTFTPLPGLNGQHSFAYTIADAGGLESRANVSLDIAAVSAGVTLTIEEGPVTEVLGTNALVNASTTGLNHRSSVASLDNGGYVVTWMTGTGSSVTAHARVFDVNGAAVTGDLNLGAAIEGPAAYLTNASVVGLPGGGFATVRATSTGLTVQQFNAAGTQVATTSLTLSVQTNFPSSPQLVVLANGDLVVTYCSDGADASGYGVVGQKIGPTGALVGTRFGLTQTTDQAQMYQDIVATADGGFAAIWDSSPDGYLYFRRFDSTGAAAGNEIRVTPGTTIASFATIAALEDGSMVVGYRRGANIELVRYTDAGVQIGATLSVTGANTNSPELNLVALPTGGFIVFYNGQSQTVRMSRYDADGNLVVGNVTVSTGMIWGPDSATLNEAGQIILTSYVSAGTGRTDVVTRVIEATILHDGPEDSAMALHLSMTQVDPSEPGAVLITGVPLNATLSAGVRQEDGSWLLTPAQLEGLTLTAPDFAGTLEIEVTAYTDGDIDNADTQTFEVTFRPVSDAPRTTEDTVQGSEDTAVTFSPLANDLDPDGGALTITHLMGQAVAVNGTVTVAGIGTFRLNADQSVTFTPVANWSGDLAFTYTARNTTGLSTNGNGTLNLAGVTDGGSFTYGQISDWTPVAIDPADVRVNTTTAGVQSQSSVAALADGGYLITWVSAGQDGSGLGVYSQRYNAQGQTVGGEVLVNHLTAGDQQNTAVLAMADGGWVIAWMGPVTGTSVTGVYARRYDANGAVTQTHLITDAVFYAERYPGSAFNQGAPTLTHTSDGGFLVGWTTFYSASDTDIWTRRVAADGTPAASTRLVRADAGLEDHMQVATDSQGRIWRLFQEVDGHYSGPTAGWDRNYGIYIGYEGASYFLQQVNTTIAGQQTNPAMTFLSNGNIVVAWQTPDASGTGIMFRILDSEGQPILAERWANRTTAGNQSSPHVEALADGTFLILWTSAGTDGSGAGVYGQRLNADGTLYYGSEFRLNATTSGDQTLDNSITDTSFAVLADGTLVATWWGAGEVFHRRFDPPEASFTGYQDTPISIPFSVTLADTSETYEMVIWGVPDGAALSAGVQRPDGSWLVTAAQAAGLNLLTPDGFAGDILLRFEFTTIDGDSRSTGSSYRSMRVLPVNNEADGAVVTFRTGADAFTAGDINITQTSGGDYPDGGVAALTGGGYVVTFSSDWADADRWAVNMIVFDAQGSALNPPGSFSSRVRVNTYETSTQNGATPLALADGGFMVFWHSHGQDGSEWGIYGQRFTAGGVKIGGEFRVNTTTNLIQEAPAVTLLSDGGFVVVFESQPAAGQFEIRGQRYNANAQPVDGEFLVRPVTGGASQRWPDVTALENGGFAVVWSTFETDGSGGGVDMRIYDSRGDTNIYRINQITAGSQGDVKVTTLADGSFLVTWMTYTDQPGAVNGISARRFEVRDGVLTASAETVITSGLGGSHVKPDVVALADGGFIIVWNWESADDNGVDLYARRYDAEGRAIGGPFRINAESFGHQHSLEIYSDPMVTIDHNGDMLVVWTDDRDGNIYSRRFEIDPDPPFVGEAGEAIRVDLGVVLRDASETVDIVLSNIPSGAVLSAGVQRPDGTWLLTVEQLEGLTLTVPINYAGGDFDLVATVTTHDGGDAYATVAYHRVQVWPASGAALQAISALVDDTGKDAGQPIVCPAEAEDKGDQPLILPAEDEMSLDFAEPGRPEVWTAPVDPLDQPLETRADWMFLP